MQRSSVLLFAVALACAAASVHAQTAWKPERNVELLIAPTAGTGPGGADHPAAVALDTAELAYWDDVFRRLATSPEWKQELEANYLSNDFMDSATTRRHLAEHYGEVKQILTDLGLAKAPK